MEVPERSLILAYSKREDKRDVLVLRKGLESSGRAGNRNLQQKAEDAGGQALSGCGV